MAAIAQEPLVSSRALALPAAGAFLPSTSAEFSSTLALRPRVEDATTLQKRLRSEGEDLETAKHALRRMSKTLDVYRQRLSALAGPELGQGHPSSSSSSPARASASVGIAQRAREVVRSMEADILRGGRSDAELGIGTSTVSRVEAGLPARSSVVLRQSLDEAQRRCKSLSGDMVQQTQTNEELVEALGSVKDANKRLLEQIRFQTDEIAQLTQQRVSDEERGALLKQNHQADQETFILELRRRLAEFRDSAGGQQLSLQVCLTDKLRSFQMRLEMIGQDTVRTLQQHRQLQGDAVGLVQAFQVQMEAAIRDATLRCTAFEEAHMRQHKAVKESMRSLEVKLAAEREAFQAEGLDWSHRHSSVLSDAEDVRARTMRDLAQLTSQLQALERILVSERQSWTEEDANIQTRIRTATAQHTKKAEELDQLQKNLIRLEVAVSEANADIKAKDLGLEGLRRLASENEAALAAALSGNEHLRGQLEEQRLHFEKTNVIDLADAQSSHERKLAGAAQVQDTDAGLSLRHQRTLEDRLRQEEDTVRSAMAQLNLLEGECDSLQQDVSAQRSQHDTARAERQGFEKELAEARQAVALERLQLQAEGDQTNAAIAAAGEDVQRMEEHIGHFRRASGAREANHGARQAASEAAVRDLHEQVAELKKRLLEASEARLHSDSEAANDRCQALEAQAALEHGIEQARRESQDSRRRLGDALLEEERGLAQARKDFENERESGLTMLRRAQDESRSKLGVAETNKARLEENFRADVAEVRETTSQRSRRCEVLEHELGNLRRSLSEKEANLSWVREEAERDEQESSVALRQMTEDARSVRAALEKAVREEASLARQLEEASHRQGQEQQRLVRELDGVRAAAAREVVELQDRLQTPKPDLNVLHLQSGRTSLERSREEMQPEPDNSRLRSLLSEHGRGSEGLTFLHSKLENHIQRLQRHTEELRSSLHSGAAGAPPAAGSAQSRRSMGTCALPSARVEPSVMAHSVLSGS